MLALALVAACSSGEDVADVVFEGGTVHLTLERTTGALAVRHGVVVATGDGARDWIGEETEVIDLAGAHALPGLQDAHTHLLPGNFVMDRLLLLGADQMDFIVQQVARYAEEAPDEPWIVGFGWTATREEDLSGVALDPVTGGRPALIADGAGHSALVNSRAMELAGITRDTPDPPGGKIVRDPETGEPTGWLREEALALVSEVALADYTDERLAQGLERRLETFVSSGLTGIADVMASPGFDVTRPWIYADLEAAGRLPIRIHYHAPIDDVDDVHAAADLRGQYDGELLRFAGGKLWVDGSASSGEAWTHEPLANDPGHHGSHYFEPAELDAIVAAAEVLGVPLKLHAMGDAAVAAALDAIERAAGLEGPRLQHTIEHAVLVDPADMARMQTLGVAASVQPILYVGAQLGDLDVLWGQERFDRAYDFQGFVDAGVTLAMGTDWPIFPSADPIIGMWGATLPPDGAALSVEEALRGYTTGTATAVSRPDLGHLEVGASADLLILGDDPRSVDPGDLSDLSPLQVWVAGRRVWQAEI